MRRPTLRLALTGALVTAAALTVTGAALAGPDAPPTPGYVAAAQPAPNDSPAPPDRDCPRDKGAGERRGPAPQPAPGQPAPSQPAPSQPAPGQPATPTGADL